MIVPTKKGVSASSLLVSLAGVPLADAMKTPAITINGKDIFERRIDVRDA